VKSKISIVTLGVRDIAHSLRFYRDGLGFTAQAIGAGATAKKPPQDVFWGGYSGYFSDPDGFLWEVAFNPFIDLS